MICGKKHLIKLLNDVFFILNCFHFLITSTLIWSTVAFKSFLLEPWFDFLLWLNFSFVLFCLPVFLLMPLSSLPWSIWKNKDYIFSGANICISFNTGKIWRLVHAFRVFNCYYLVAWGVECLKFSMKSLLKLPLSVLNSCFTLCFRQIWRSPTLFQPEPLHPLTWRVPGRLRWTPEEATQTDWWVGSAPESDTYVALWPQSVWPILGNSNSWSLQWFSLIYFAGWNWVEDKNKSSKQNKKLKPDKKPTLIVLNSLVV